METRGTMGHDSVHKYHSLEFRYKTFLPLKNSSLLCSNIVLYIFLLIELLLLNVNRKKGQKSKIKFFKRIREKQKKKLCTCCIRIFLALRCLSDISIIFFACENFSLKSGKKFKLLIESFFKKAFPKNFKSFQRNFFLNFFLKKLS